MILLPTTGRNSGSFRFNPGCSQQPVNLQHLDNTLVSDYEERDNDSVSMPPNDDDALLFDEEESFHIYDNVVDNDFNHFHEGQALPNACGYPSFTTSQKCLTSLMILLDSLECPDYAFKKILRWARTSFVAGFDFN